MCRAWFRGDGEAAGARLGNGVARVAEMVPRPQKLQIEMPRLIPRHCFGADAFISLMTTFERAIDSQEGLSLLGSELHELRAAVEACDLFRHQTCP